MTDNYTSSLNDLLADMRRQVEYSDKITMPVPLYERMKTAITAMGDARKGASDEPPLEGEGSSAPTPSPTTYTLIGLLPCPWCGSSGKLSPPEPVTAPHKDWWTVVCSNPECQMDSAYAGDSSQECIQVWNTRVSVDQMDANHHRESVRCMSKVFNDLAHELGISKEKYGDPELLFDAISSLKEKHAYSEIPVVDERTNKLNSLMSMACSNDIIKVSLKEIDKKFSELTSIFTPLELLSVAISRYIDLPTTPVREIGGWQPMETAPKDGTAILLKFKDDLSSYNRCNDDWHETWQGIAFVGRNRGDEGQWAFAAPVGHGGFTDVWFEGWKPISESEGQKP